MKLARGGILLEEWVKRPRRQYKITLTPLHDNLGIPISVQLLSLVHSLRALLLILFLYGKAAVTKIICFRHG
jgi:hypothetical protein